MGFTEKVRGSVEKVRSRIKEAPIKKYEEKMRKLDASAQKIHRQNALVEKRLQTERQIRELKNNISNSKIKIKREKIAEKNDRVALNNDIATAKVDRLVSKKQVKSNNDIKKAKSKITKQLQSAVIDVIDGKPVNSDMLKFAKGSPVYRAMLKIKQGFTIGKENRELAAIRADMMSTNPLKREAAIKRFARSIENMQAIRSEKLKDYAAKRERKARLGEAAIKYGSMLGSATAISGALGSMYGGNDDDEA